MANKYDWLGAVGKGLSAGVETYESTRRQRVLEAARRRAEDREQRKLQSDMNQARKQMEMEQLKLDAMLETTRIQNLQRQYDYERQRAIDEAAGQLGMIPPELRAQFGEIALQGATIYEKDRMGNLVPTSVDIPLYVANMKNIAAQMSGDENNLGGGSGAYREVSEAIQGAGTIQDISNQIGAIQEGIIGLTPDETETLLSEALQKENALMVQQTGYGMGQFQAWDPSAPVDTLSLEQLQEQFPLGGGQRDLGFLPGSGQNLAELTAGASRFEAPPGTTIPAAPAARRQPGFQFGPIRSDLARPHPDLVPMPARPTAPDVFGPIRALARGPEPRSTQIQVPEWMSVPMTRRGEWGGRGESPLYAGPAQDTTRAPQWTPAPQRPGMDLSQRPTQVAAGQPRAPNWPSMPVAPIERPRMDLSQQPVSVRPTQPSIPGSPSMPVPPIQVPTTRPQPSEIERLMENLMLSPVLARARGERQSEQSAQTGPPVLPDWLVPTQRPGEWGGQGKPPPGITPQPDTRKLGWIPVPTERGEPKRPMQPWPQKPSAEPQPPPSYRQTTGQVDTDTMRFLQALSQVETGGQQSPYQATPQFGTQAPPSSAFGRYQMTEGFWKDYAPEALGVDEAQAMKLWASRPGPNEQDTVARHAITKLYDRYGNWDDVASVWYTGRPKSKHTPESWRQPIVTTVGGEQVRQPSPQEYVERLNQYLRTLR